MFLVAKIHRINHTRLDGIYGIMNTVAEAEELYGRSYKHALEDNGNASCYIYEVAKGCEDFYKALYDQHADCLRIYGYSPVEGVFFVPNSLRRVK